MTIGEQEDQAELNVPRCTRARQNEGLAMSESLILGDTSAAEVAFGRARARPGWLLLCGLLTSFFLFGCAANQAGAENPEDAASQSENSRKGQEHAALEPLVPVPAPEGVVLRARLKDPLGLSDGVLQAVGIPFDLAELMNRGETSDLMGVIDFSAPVEAAVTLNPANIAAPFRFASLGTKGVQPVLLALEKRGVVVMEGPAGIYHFAWDDEPCAVGRSMGQSPARVVCSDDKDSLLGSLDYALRGLVNESLSESDLYVQADFRPLKARFGKEMQRVQLLASVGARQLHVGHPKFDRALTDAAIGLAEELAALALDSKTLEFELDEKAGDFSSTLRFTFENDQSTVVRSLREQAAKQGPAPKMFRNLPADTAFAEYTRELEPERAEAWMSVVTDLVTGWAEYKGASLEFSKRLGRVVGALGPEGNTMVLARGPLVVEGAGPSAGLGARFGVIGTSEEFKKVVQVLDDLSWLLSSGELSEIDEEFSQAPQLARHAAGLKGSPGAAVYRWNFPAGFDKLEQDINMPSDLAVHAELEKWLDGYVAVHRSGNVTWISLSPEGTAELTASFLAVENPGKKTLKDQPELRAVLDTPAAAAGFYKLDGFAGLVSFLIPPEMALKWPGLLRSAPRRGQVPMSFDLSIGTKQETEFVYRWQTPKDFTRDAATIATIFISEIRHD